MALQAVIRRGIYTLAQQLCNRRLQRERASVSNRLAFVVHLDDLVTTQARVERWMRGLFENVPLEIGIEP